jgi:hypothetical protein
METYQMTAPPLGSTSSNLAISNNGFILYQQSGKTKVMDFSTKQVLANLTPATDAHIAPDGQYFVNGADLYKFNGTDFTLSETLPYSGIKFLHFMASDNMLVIATETQVIVYDYIARSVSTTHNFATGTSGYRSFDNLNKTYIVSGSASLIRLNVVTGEVKSNVVYDPHNCSITGNYLFHQNGFGLNLE